MKKALSLLIEFLIYSSFALLALSYVLYHVYIVSEREKSKLEIENIINILNEFHSILNVYKECGICGFTFRKNLPERAEIILVNNSSYISAIYFSKTNHSITYRNVDITITKVLDGFQYNISKITYNYFLNGTSNLKLTKEFCIKVKIFFNSILIDSC